MPVPSVASRYGRQAAENATLGSTSAYFEDPRRPILGCSDQITMPVHDKEAPQAHGRALPVAEAQNLSGQSTCGVPLNDEG